MASNSSQEGVESRLMSSSKMLCRLLKFRHLLSIRRPSANAKRQFLRVSPLIHFAFCNVKRDGQNEFRIIRNCLNPSTSLLGRAWPIPLASKVATLTASTTLLSQRRMASCDRDCRTNPESPSKRATPVKSTNSSQQTNIGLRHLGVAQRSFWSSNGLKRTKPT
jgi:hypothetical protein